MRALRKLKYMLTARRLSFPVTTVERKNITLVFAAVNRKNKLTTATRDMHKTIPDTTNTTKILETDKIPMAKNNKDKTQHDAHDMLAIKRVMT
jgi:hypothetical protein